MGCLHIGQATSNVSLPPKDHILMYKPNVPQNERVGLASGENRIRERPLITLDTRISQRAG